MPASLEVLQTRLANIETAIARVETGGQKYSHEDGASTERAQLATLYRERRQLEKQISRAQNGGPFRRAQIGGI
jgi:hypothetical protein